MEQIEAFSQLQVCAGYLGATASWAAITASRWNAISDAQVKEIERLYFEVLSTYLAAAPHLGFTVKEAGADLRAYESKLRAEQMETFGDFFEKSNEKTAGVMTLRIYSDVATKCLSDIGKDDG